MRPTIVFVKAHYVSGRLVHYPGDEMPPGTFSQETINRALDEGHLAEVDPAVRPSLYHMFFVHRRHAGATQARHMFDYKLTRREWSAGEET
jgi:hypothetical protein